MTGHAKAHVSFEALLQSLSLDWRDEFTRRLVDTGSVLASRLAFRALREVVDGSLIKTALHIKTTHKQRAAAGERSPVWRWPRLKELSICATPEDYDDEGGLERSTLLALPLVGLPAYCQQRIERLSLRCSNRIALPATCLSSIIYRLPNLRFILFSLTLSVDPGQLLLLFDALASLPRLEELQLPTCFLLQYAGPLANRLTALELHDNGSRDNHAALGEGWLLPVLAQMRSLRKLYLVFCSEGSDQQLAELLNHLPAGLEMLELSLPAGLYWPGPADVSLALESRRIVSVATSSACVPLQFFARFVGSVLLPCRWLGPQLRLCLLEKLELSGEDGGEEQLQSLRALARLCHQRVELRELLLHPAVEPEVILRTLEALGCLPQTVLWLTRCPHLRLDGETAAAARRLAADAAEAWSAAAAGGLSQGPAQRTALAERMLDRVLAAAAAAAAPGGASLVASTSGAAAGDAAAPSVGTGGHDGRLVHLVVLRSPFLRVLARSADALLVWMRDLEPYPFRLVEPDPMRSYLFVPSKAVMLVAFRTAEGAAAVAAAARGAFGADEAGTTAAVEVHALAAGPASWEGSTWLRRELFNAVQEFWDSGAGGSELERLKLLLELSSLARFCVVADIDREEESETEEWEEGNEEGNVEDED